MKTLLVVIATLAASITVVAQPRPIQLPNLCWVPGTAAHSPALEGTTAFAEDDFQLGWNWAAPFSAVGQRMRARRVHQGDFFLTNGKNSATATDDMQESFHEIYVPSMRFISVVRGMSDNILGGNLTTNPSQSPAVEYVLHDHLSSARITLDNAARVIESRSYTAFGDELTSSGTGARTSYIGRETDKESDLGFNGVRMYEPLYGRFLSTDPLWAKYLPLQSYQYAGNSPVMMLDDGGKEIVPVNLTDEEKAAVSRLIEFVRSKNDPQLNAILSYAESSESTIHLYSMPPERVYGGVTFSRFNQHNEILEDRFYDDENRVGLTLQVPLMAIRGQADVMIRSDVLGSPNYMLLVALLDEFNHVMSDGIDESVEKKDHNRLFSHLLALHDRGILALPAALYFQLREKVKETQPRADDSEQQPEAEPVRGGSSE